MASKVRLPLRGDFITLGAPRERSAVAICVGHTRAGSLRVRRLIIPNPARTCFESMATYRGPWRPLPVTDPRHPAFDPTPDATLIELGL